MVDKQILAMALRMYSNEPCRICGEMIEVPHLKTAVFAGYSKDNKSRAAHGECWDKNISMTDWEYPPSKEEIDNYESK